MLAARQFVQGINDRIKRRPELLTVPLTETHEHGGISTKKRPLFIIFQEWIDKSFAYRDTSYDKQFYDWLISGEVLLPPVEGKTRLFYGLYENSKIIIRLLKTYNVVHQKFVDVDKLINALECLPFGTNILQEYSQEVLNQHFEDFKNAESSDYYDRGKESCTEEQRRSACRFINEMRIMSIVTDKTEMFHTIHGYRDYDPSTEYKEFAVSYLSTQTKRIGYELLKIPANVLISDRLATLLKAKASLADIERIQNCIKAYTRQDLTKAAEFALFIKDILLQALNEHWPSECKTNLVLFTVQQAIVSKDSEYILSALKHLNELLQETNNSDEWYRIFAIGFAASQATGLNKDAIADKILEPVAERFGPEHIIPLRQRLVERRAESPGRLLFSMQFKAPSDDARHEPTSTKRMRPDFS